MAAFATPSHKSKHISTQRSKETLAASKTTARRKPSTTAESKAFKEEQIMYVFEDNQYIHSGSDEKGFKDATHCYKFNLTDRLKKYFFYVEGLSQSEQPLSPDQMIRN
jgi:hypothetical protein